MLLTKCSINLPFHIRTLYIPFTKYIKKQDLDNLNAYAQRENEHEKVINLDDSFQSKSSIRSFQANIKKFSPRF